MTLRRAGGPSRQLAATAELPRLGFPVPAASPEERERLAEVLS